MHGLALTTALQLCSLVATAQPYDQAYAEMQQSGRPLLVPLDDVGMLQGADDRHLAEEPVDGRPGRGALGDDQLQGDLAACALAPLAAATTGANALLPGFGSVSPESAESIGDRHVRPQRNDGIGNGWRPWSRL